VLEQKICLEIGIRLPEGESDIFHHSMQTRSVAYPMDTDGSFRGSKEAGT
jgi:hypothetical protein